MRVECIEFKRCCCCLPLRYGLLVWGYLKLAVSMILILPLLFGSLEDINRSGFYIQLTLLGVFIIMMFADIALTIVFVIGCHKKSPKLLRVYNYYSIGILVLYVISFFLFHGAHSYFLIRRAGTFDAFIILKPRLILGFFNMVLQVYIILLNKTEINKLEKNCNYRFSNNADEAECQIVEENGIIGNGAKNESQNGVYNEIKRDTYIKNNGTEYEVNNENNYDKN